MLIKKLYVASVVSLALATLSTGAVFAVEPSDYARDVSDGQAEVKASPDAASNQTEVQSDETVSAQVDDVQVQVDQAIGAQEGQMGDNESGESQGGSVTDNGQPQPTPPSNSGSGGY